MTDVNVNRQRPTADRLWGQLLNYVAREELGGLRPMPLRSLRLPDAKQRAALRRPDVREQLRNLVRLGTGEAMPTRREVLAILTARASGSVRPLRRPWKATSAAG